MLNDAEFQQICDDCALTPGQFLAQPAMETLRENEISDALQARSAQDSVALNFLAAGAYRHFIPAGVRARRLDNALSKRFQGAPLDATSRARQTRIEQAFCALSGMPECRLLAQDIVSTLAAVLTHEVKPGKVLLAATVAPAIRHALRCRLKHQSIDLVVIDYDKQTGIVGEQQLQAYAQDGISAVIVAWPNFFSLLEDIEQISRFTQTRSAALIVLAQPLALHLLEAPGAGDEIDFMLGDLAALGLPANRQGCAPSMLLSKQKLSPLLRDMAHQQNIPELPQIADFMRRLGATDGLHGLQRSRRLLEQLLQKLTEIAQVSIRFSSAQLFECVIRLQGIDLQNAQRILSGHNMLPGYFLADEYPELQDCLLLACSDLHSDADIDKFAGKIATVVKNLSTAGCPVKPKF